MHEALAEYKMNEQPSSTSHSCALRQVISMHYCAKHAPCRPAPALHPNSAHAPGIAWRVKVDGRVVGAVRPPCVHVSLRGMDTTQTRNITRTLMSTPCRMYITSSRCVGVGCTPTHVLYMWCPATTRSVCTYKRSQVHARTWGVV